jgi:hypothetical protein
MVFFKKRVLFEWFRDRWKEQTDTTTFQQNDNVCFKLSQLFIDRFLFFLYDPFTTSLHGLKKSIIHGAI